MIRDQPTVLTISSGSLAKRKEEPCWPWEALGIWEVGSTLFLHRFLVHSFLKLTLETFCLVVVKYY